METQKLIEKLEQLTGKIVILKEATLVPVNKNIGEGIQLTEANAVSAYSLQAGNIFEIPNRGKYVVVNSGSIGRSITKTPVIHVSEIDSTIKSGTSSTIGMLSSRPGATYTIIGQLEPKKVKVLQDILNGIWKKKYEKAKENFSKISWDNSRHEHCVELENGKKAFKGDVVSVQFSNGSFKGTIKAVAGNKDGKVTILFGNRTKGTTVSPEKIIDIVGNVRGY